MKIGTATCEKGQKATGYIHTAWLGDCSEVRVPVMLVRGAQDGPVLWINAGVHGQEVSGIFAIHRLFDLLDPAQIKGAVVATPGCNPLGLKGHNKFTPEDQLDLDQQFPGRPDGWLSEQMAYHFFREVKDTANYMLDLHALGGVDAAPYTVFKSAAGVDPKINADTQALALLMQAPFNCHVDLTTATGELPGSVMGALDIQCILNGIPAVMVEMGAGNRVVWENVDRVCEGIQRVMRYIGLLDGEAAFIPGQKIVTKRCFPTNTRGGLVFPQVKPGSILKGGALIALVKDYVGNVLEEIRAPQDCIVIGILENPIANAGTVITAMGLEWYETDQ